MSDETVAKAKLISDEQIRAILGSTFGVQVDIAECKPILSGYNNTLFEIKTLNPDRHVVLRAAPNSDVPAHQRERKVILAEPVKYDLLSKAGVPTARVLAIDGSRSIIDRDYLIIDYIDAVPMNHPSVPADVRPGIMQQVGRYTAMMHGISSDKFGWIMQDGSIRGSENWSEVFGEIFTEACNNCSEEGIISAPDIAAVIDCYWSCRAVFDECRTPAFTHNDIWDPNILVREKDGEWIVEGIIDVDEALFADREFEFVIWEGADPDLLLGYDIPPDKSPNALLRKKFYRMQLYMHYAWFYQIMSMSPEFQKTSTRIAVDILQELLS
ncbi:MAG TPA: aminoglycoside phosphotransferase family protein [Armatimonadota bacterium]|nr:aminoglycoside phosphotransferase family protein [Armatimonadota bacterium]